MFFPLGHLFRKSSPYTFPGGVSEVVYSNTARAAMVWMDEWADFYFKFTPEASSLRSKINVDKRLELRQRLKCKSFKWYLTKIWPQHFFPMDNRFFGKIRNKANNVCLRKPIGKGATNQPMGIAQMENCLPEDNLIEMFVMTKQGYIMTDDSVCIGPDTNAEDVDTEVDDFEGVISIMACSDNKKKRWKYDKETLQVIQESSGFCWDLSATKANRIVAKKCDGDKLTQQFIFETIPWR